VTRQEVLERLRAELAEMFELDRDAITLEAHLKNDLGLDSIDAVDMAVKLQQLTGKKVPLKDMMTIRTVADVVEVVMNHLGEMPPQRSVG
jgi:acyl carrier protein